MDSKLKEDKQFNTIVKKYLHLTLVLDVPYVNLPLQALWTSVFTYLLFHRLRTPPQQKCKRMWLTLWNIPLHQIPSFFSLTASFLNLR